MSGETATWLNSMIVVGDTDRRGNAWWYRADLSEGNDNHYAGAIPFERIERLFKDWEPVSAPIFIQVPTTADDPELSGMNADGIPFRTVELKDRQAITPIGHPANVLGIFSRDGYQIHGYTEWLAKTLANLVDDDVHFTSAGLLMNGGVGWVEMTVTEEQTVNDFPFIPNILAYTSVNGKYTTNYKRAIQAVVCDNTLSAAASEKNGQSLKVKHSKYSKAKLADARSALGIIMATADEFTAHVEEMCAWKVTDQQWSKFLDLAVPLNTDSETGQPLSKMAVTKNENKRERLTAMYRNDIRCAPWNGSAWGVAQTMNTYWHHERGTKGSTVRGERNQIDAISGATEKMDTMTQNWLTVATA